MNRIATVAIAAIIVGGAATALAIPDDTAALPPAAAPGIVASTDAQEVCSVAGGSYSRRHRFTPESLKHYIRRRDGCSPPSEVDHRVPLALGGADEEGNLWCQPGNAIWNFHDKDKLEVWAWDQVCHHSAALAPVQAMFLAPDWRIEYCKVFWDVRCGRVK